MTKIGNQFSTLTPSISTTKHCRQAAVVAMNRGRSKESFFVQKVRLLLNMRARHMKKTGTCDDEFHRFSTLTPSISTTKHCRQPAVVAMNRGRSKESFFVQKVRLLLNMRARHMKKTGTCDDEFHRFSTLTGSRPATKHYRRSKWVAISRKRPEASFCGPKLGLLLQLCLVD